VTKDYAGIVGLLVSALLATVGVALRTRDEKAREARQAKRTLEAEARAAEEHEAERQRAEREREEREDRQEISRRLGALETARGEHHSELVGLRAELRALSAGQARLEEKTSQILDAVLDGTRRRRR
jgi:Flp pilus assembly protein TadB